MRHLHTGRIISRLIHAEYDALAPYGRSELGSQGCMGIQRKFSASFSGMFGDLEMYDALDRVTVTNYEDLQNGRNCKIMMLWN